MPTEIWSSLQDKINYAQNVNYIWLSFFYLNFENEFEKLLCENDLKSFSLTGKDLYIYVYRKGAER